MTSIQLKEPPARPANGRRPLMALDKRIMELASEPRRPVTIADQLRREGHNVTTQRVAARLKSLVNRDLMIRIRPKGGPPNGPGTSRYMIKPPEGAGTDG